jgi:septal ring factor EnvC (AmiA/AmiB activator)
VIIDHGCGIYSWYCGLSQIYLAVGDIVAAGDRLGKAGSTLSANGEQTLLLMTTVGKTAIDPAFLRNDPPRFEGN